MYIIGRHTEDGIEWACNTMTMKAWEFTTVEEAKDFLQSYNHPNKMSSEELEEKFVFKYIPDNKEMVAINADN